MGVLVTPATDPFSGQPEAKATPVAITPVAFAYRGFALTRRPVTLPAATWWTRVAVNNGQGLLLASNERPARWREMAQDLFAGTELAELLDEPSGHYRIVAFVEGRLTGCLFIGPAESALPWDRVKNLFEGETLSEADRGALLSGSSVDENGPLICACFGVGLNTIRTVLTEGTAANVADIGMALGAGTNCGSCLPELKRIVRRELAQTL